MFGHYLPNKNEGATVVPNSKFRELNKGSIDTGIGPDLELTSRLRYDMLRGSIKPSRLGSRPCILAMSNSTSQFQLPLWLENLLLDKCTPSFLNYLSLLVFVPQV